MCELGHLLFYWYSYHDDDDDNRYSYSHDNHHQRSDFYFACKANMRSASSVMHERLFLRPGVGQQFLYLLNRAGLRYSLQ